MNSRERVLASINHQQPDQVAIDLGGTPSSNISAIAYNNLKKYLHMTEGKTKIYDVVQQVIVPEKEIMDLFGIDVIDLAQEFCKDDDKWYEVELADGSKGFYPKWFTPSFNDKTKSWEAFKNGEMIARMPQGATFFDQTVFPYIDDYPDNYDDLDYHMSRVLWQGFAHSPWDEYKDESFWDILRSKAIELRAKTDKAIVFTCGCNLFEWGTFLRRMDNFLMDIYTDDKSLVKYSDKIAAKVCNYYTIWQFLWYNIPSERFIWESMRKGFQ
jgi:uroporphyrinogen decarboxylase